MLVSANGSTVDLIANQSIRSGKIAAYHRHARQRAGAGAEPARQPGRDDGAGAVERHHRRHRRCRRRAERLLVDTTGWLNGNRINLTYTDTATNTQHQVSIVRVDDPAALPLTNSATADPNDEVVGVDFSGGLASVVTQLNARFGGGLQFSNPSGTTLQVLDDGGANTTDVNALSMTRTATALANGSVALPLFTDGSGAVHRRDQLGSARRRVGFAGRIAVNPALLGDPSKLVLYGTGVGDAAIRRART